MAQNDGLFSGMVALSWVFGGWRLAVRMEGATL
jgi:hypothetical protein